MEEKFVDRNTTTRERQGGFDCFISQHAPSCTRLLPKPGSPNSLDFHQHSHKYQVKNKRVSGFEFEFIRIKMAHLRNHMLLSHAAEKQSLLEEKLPLSPTVSLL